MARSDLEASALQVRAGSNQMTIRSNNTHWMYGVMRRRFMMDIPFLCPLYARAGDKFPGRFIVFKGAQGFLELCLSQVSTDDERCTDLERIRATTLFERSEPNVVKKPELRHRLLEEQPQTTLMHQNAPEVIYGQDVFQHRDQSEAGRELFLECGRLLHLLLRDPACFHQKSSEKKRDVWHITPWLYDGTAAPPVSLQLLLQPPEISLILYDYRH